MSVTVGELIEHLKKFDQSSIVLTKNSHYGYDELYLPYVETIHVLKNNSHMFGQYIYYDNSDISDLIHAVLID